MNSIPPSYPESERAVLSCMMKSEKAVSAALEALQPADFTDPANRAIFEAMQALVANDHRKPDLVLVCAELKSQQRLDMVGGERYVMQVSTAAPSAVTVKDYIGYVQEASARRNIMALGARLQERAAGTDATDDIIFDAEQQLSGISAASGKGGLQHIEPILIDTFGHIEELYKNHGQVKGVQCGYADLDDLLTGLHPGELILIAGRPAMGKTSIGMNIIENATIRGGKTAAVFSLEMPARQLAMRMLCTEARVDMQKVRRGQVDDADWDALSDAMLRIAPANIWVDATPGATVSEIHRKARKLQIEHGLDIVLVDYLSLMSGEGRFGSRQEEVSSISRSLKRMAIDLDVPVLVLQQLSRAPAGRANHRPLLSDIRESGAIEQDADVVMFIHREGYYDPDAPQNEAELIIAKQRNGSLGTVNLEWHGRYTYFRDTSPYPREASGGSDKA